MRRLLRRLRAALREESSAPYCWLYTRHGTTLRGTLVGRDREAYTLAHADVAPQGASGFRQLQGRVRVLRETIDYWTESSP